MAEPDKLVVMVSGCFDLLHSGHIAFLTAAARYGQLVVALGSDRTIATLKGQSPWCSEDERLYVVKALRPVADAFISRGSGILDFEAELRALRPQCFVVNEDGDHPGKRELCQELDIEYIVLQREPEGALPVRSSTSLRQHLAIPYRIEICGGWLDQPVVSKFCSGPVIVASIEPRTEYVARSGLATSSRAAAKRFWGPRIPPGNPIELAQQLFALENPPGTVDVAGSQDQIGLLVPGVSKLTYNGAYWPSEIQTLYDEPTLAWLEQSLWLVPMGNRPAGFQVRKGERIYLDGVTQLAAASESAWSAILARDAPRLGSALSDCLEAQCAMFPAMAPPELMPRVQAIQGQCYGAKFTGAGGGGYLLAVADNAPADALALSIRRSPVEGI